MIRQRDQPFTFRKHNRDMQLLANEFEDQLQAQYRKLSTPSKSTPPSQAHKDFQDEMSECLKPVPIQKVRLEEILDSPPDKVVPPPDWHFQISNGLTRQFLASLQNGNRIQLQDFTGKLLELVRGVVRNESAEKQFKKWVKEKFTTTDPGLISIDKLRFQGQKKGVIQMALQEYCELYLRVIERQMSKANEKILAEFEQLKKDFELREEHLQEQSHKVNEREKEVVNREKKSRHLLQEEYGRLVKKMDNSFQEKVNTLEQHSKEAEKRIRAKLKAELTLHAEKVQRFSTLQTESSTLKAHAKTLQAQADTLRKKNQHLQGQVGYQKQAVQGTLKANHQLKEQLKRAKDRTNQASKLVKELDNQRKRTQSYREESVRLKKELAQLEKDCLKLKAAIPPKTEKEPETPWQLFFDSLLGTLQCTLPQFINFHLKRAVSLDTVDLGELVHPRCTDLLPPLLACLTKSKKKSEGMVQLLCDMVFFSFTLQNKDLSRPKEMVLFDMNSCIKTDKKDSQIRPFNDGGGCGLTTLLQDEGNRIAQPGIKFACWSVVLLLNQKHEEAVLKLLELVKQEVEHEIKAVIHKNRILPLLIIRANQFLKQGTLPMVMALLDALLLLTCNSPYQRDFLQAIGSTQYLEMLLEGLEEEDEDIKASSIVLLERVTWQVRPQGMLQQVKRAARRLSKEQSFVGTNAQALLRNLQ